MATAKKAAPKAATTPVKGAPTKVVKPVAKKVAPKAAVAKKAPVSKTAKAIAKISASLANLGERKSKLDAEIKTLKDQRIELKAQAAPAATPAKAPAKPAVKPAAKVTKAVAKTAKTAKKK